MIGRRTCHVLAAAAALQMTAAVRAEAQGFGRVAVEMIAAASTEARTLDDPAVILDLVTTVRLRDGWDIVVRPWSRRRPGGDWSFEMYQLQLRYVSSTRVPFRVDAGIISSPLGLSTLELQPNRNPLIGGPFYYFVPLPPVDGRSDRVHLLSGGYPLGAIVSASGARWDARAGVTDGTAARPRSVFSESRPPAEPQLVVGGGVTPVTGLRIGAGFSRGRYRALPVWPSGSTVDARTATLFNVEGEYALGYTRISGEWVRDRFDAPSGAAIARGFNVQAAQTLSPRFFTAARATHASSPVLTAPSEVRRRSTAFEATLGYRVSPSVTARGGYQRTRAFNADHWEHAAVMSIVWFDRWW